MSAVPLTLQLLNFCAALLLLLSFSMLSQRRVVNLVNLLAVQGSVLLLATLLLAGKLVAAGGVLALIETVSAKLRVFRAPEFLATAFLFAVLGLLVHLLLGA